MKKSKKIKLTPSVNFNENTGSFEILLDEAGIFGAGKTKQEAVNKFMDEAKDSSTEFFYNLDFYSEFPKLMEKYQYFLSIGKCKSRNELIHLFHLDK